MPDRRGSVPTLPIWVTPGHYNWRRHSWESNSSANSSLVGTRGLALPKVVIFSLFIAFFTISMGIILSVILYKESLHQKANNGTNPT
ncbi:Hypothetical protein NTJ_12453 [Nesidiocoris tenuis]|uniref:Uncharacterized protein n=1 Tax=Nesidiocoris tenuis TaxID=355587 RepID=A0ABN7B5E6_9HEMI|nr:Hypothetical protein NTJ_12453 [Nesidiocoris tenuis]